MPTKHSRYTDAGVVPSPNQKACSRSGPAPLKSLIGTLKVIDVTDPIRKKNLALREIIQAALPGLLRKHCTAVTQYDDTAVIYFDSPVYGFQIRFLSEDLVHALKTQGYPSVNKVLVRTAFEPYPNTKASLLVPSTDVSECLNQFALSTSHPPLAEALLRLKNTIDKFRIKEGQPSRKQKSRA